MATVRRPHFDIPAVIRRVCYGRKNSILTFADGTVESSFGKKQVLFGDFCRL